MKSKLLIGIIGLSAMFYYSTQMSANDIILVENTNDTTVYSSTFNLSDSMIISNHAMAADTIFVNDNINNDDCRLDFTCEEQWSLHTPEFIHRYYLYR